MKARITLFAALGTAATAAFAAAAGIGIDATPTPLETHAIQQALGKDYSDMAPFTVGHADLDGDGKPDLVFRSGNSDYCGSAGCDTEALLSAAHGFRGKPIDLAYSAGDLIVLPAKHKGMHDLRFDGGSHRFAWTGSEYR